MYRFVLAVIAVRLLSGSVVHAASYKKRDWTIVDPILTKDRDPHSYSGINLERLAYLSRQAYCCWPSAAGWLRGAVAAAVSFVSRCVHDYTGQLLAEVELHSGMDCTTEYEV